VGIKYESNQIHGTAYAYGRNGDWDARDFFAAEPVPLSLQQFGGSAGGPIKKDKIFSSPISKNSGTAWAIRSSTRFRSLPPGSDPPRRT